MAPHFHCENCESGVESMSCCESEMVSGAFACALAIAGGDTTRSTPTAGGPTRGRGRGLKAEATPAPRGAAMLGRAATLCFTCPTPPVGIGSADLAIGAKTLNGFALCAHATDTMGCNVLRRTRVCTRAGERNTTG